MGDVTSQPILKQTLPGDPSKLNLVVDCPGGAPPPFVGTPAPPPICFCCPPHCAGRGFGVAGGSPARVSLGEGLPPGSMERQSSQGRGGLASDWVLFNDFSITPTTAQETVSNQLPQR